MLLISPRRREASLKTGETLPKHRKYDGWVWMESAGSGGAWRADAMYEGTHISDSRNLPGYLL